ncbi:MAG: aminotransferase class IV [Prolixibacteraceae bacterium]
MKIIISSKKKNSVKSGAISNSGEVSVYEVLRVIRRVALFLEEHYIRLTKSLDFYYVQAELNFQEFKAKIDELIELNSASDGNIKIERISTQNEITWEFSFSEHSYPSPDDYENGVKTELYFAERENPNAKVLVGNLRERVNNYIKSHELFEVLLVNHRGEITEGSRSNVFFMKENVFYTAPESEVLIGITRQKVIECLAELNFQVKEIAVAANEIENYDAVFLTGTSPKVLPVRSIGQTEFNTRLPIIKDLMNHYNKMIDSYIDMHRQ